jgi:hypothetical protein
LVVFDFMKNRNFWVFLVVLALGWSIWEIYPPTDRDLIDYVERAGAERRHQLHPIIEEARQLREGDPGEVVRQPAGRRRAPMIWAVFSPVRHFGRDGSARGDSAAVAAGGGGQDQAGAGFAGGTSFLVAMDTNQLSFRRGAGRGVIPGGGGVAEAGGPAGGGGAAHSTIGREPDFDPDAGLSEERKAEAKANIEKAAFLEFRLVHERSAELIEQGITPIGYTNMTAAHSGPEGR